MNKKSISLTNSVVKNEDRANDGNLLPITRERVLKSIKKHIQCTGRLNISEIASLIKLSRSTVKKMTDEILMEWKNETQSQILAQVKWTESTLKDIDENPETFGKEKIQVVRLKSMLLGKINILQKLLTKDDSAMVNLYLINQGDKKKLPETK